MGEIKWTHHGEMIGKRVEIPSYMDEWKAGHKYGKVIEQSTYPGTEYALIELEHQKDDADNWVMGFVENAKCFFKHIPVVMADCTVLEGE